MAGMKVNVSNKLNRIGARVEGGAGTALQAGAALMQREIMQAAMGAAIWDTGNLINSHTRRKAGPMSWDIISPAEYSVFVHQGTTSMSARPWFKAGIASAEPKVIAMLQRTMGG